MLKIVFISIGMLSLILGIIGIFVPILPTTPFLLVSVAMFAKSSPRLYNKLLTNKYLGSYIRDFRVHKAISLKIKIFAISFLWVSILVSAVFFIKIVWVRILLLLMATAVTYHIVRFKTKR